MSGRIAGLDGSDRALVVVEGPQRVEATTRVRGVWRVEGLPPGEYIVAPHHGRYTFDPPERRLVVKDRDVLQVDFQATLSPLPAPSSSTRSTTPGDTGTDTDTDTVTVTATGSNGNRGG